MPPQGDIRLPMLMGAEREAFEEKPQRLRSHYADLLFESGTEDCRRVLLLRH